LVVNRKILILDESTASRKYLASSLHEKGFTVLEAPSGREALIAAWRDMPDAILFDPVLSDIPENQFISRLRSDPRTQAMPLIALSSDPGPVRREACIQAGVDKYIVKSPQALSILEEILTSIFSRQAIVDHESEGPEPGVLIVFLSAKGGTGTSSLCANVAMNIRHGQPEARVVVADLVLPIGSIAPIVGYDENLDIATVSGLPASQTSADYFYRNLPQPELWQFQLLSGSPDPQKAGTLRGERVEQILHTLRSAYDYVVIDVGRSLSRISLPLIQRADLIALIVSTDHSTVQLTRTVLKYLGSQNIDSSKIYPILNRAVGLEGVTKTEAETILGIRIKTMMPYMGGNFSLANNLNQPITIKYPNDTASLILRELAADMVRTAHTLHSTKIS